MPGILTRRGARILLRRRLRIARLRRASPDPSPPAAPGMTAQVDGRAA
ncbi:protein of unassigned function [Methylobacterium oryzae CBMB20]|uniref:Protein of unassigned function n=1 Tax=Methylobacterium oryzae CBMB20 TaxID=693986 RepID=A0A089P0R2_9HYPH|nr:protein of unassigned function [Methylobacterium oryzae CBMB20]